MMWRLLVCVLVVTVVVALVAWYLAHRPHYYTPVQRVQWAIPWKQQHQDADADTALLDDLYGSWERREWGPRHDPDVTAWVRRDDRRRWRVMWVGKDTPCGTAYICDYVDDPADTEYVVWYFHGLIRDAARQLDEITPAQFQEQPIPIPGPCRLPQGRPLTWRIRPAQ